MRLGLGGMDLFRHEREKGENGEKWLLIIVHTYRALKKKFMKN